jgi:diapolycopene oxygenase
MAINPKRREHVAVIGSGLGGLSAAISLATEGFRVTVYEKNEKAGGKLNLLKKEGFNFDLGPSILTMPHIFEALFASANKKMSNYVEIQEVKPHWRNFFEDGTLIDLTPDLREMEKELARLPKNEADGFFDYIDYSRRLCKITEEGYFAKGLETVFELVRFYGPLRSIFGFDILRNMNAGVKRFIRSPKLIDILNYFIKYVGSSPYDAPALLNLLPYLQFGYGLWYVKGGMYNLAGGRAKLRREWGGVIHYGQEVVSLQRDGSRITGLTLKNGSNAVADIFVSNMEIVPTYERLTREDKSFLKRYAKFEPSCSGLVLHLGVNKIYPQLAHHNFFYSKNGRAHFDSIFHKEELSQDPTLYLVAPCKTDPTQAPEGCEIIKVLPHIPHLKQKNPFTRADYLALRDRVLEKLERMGLTDLRRHTVVEEMWTPEDIQTHYFSNKGSIYGVVSDRFKNLGFKAPRRSEKYSNLYFVGGSVNPGGGMPMVTLSGQLVKDKILSDIAK